LFLSGEQQVFVMLASTILLKVLTVGNDLDDCRRSTFKVIRLRRRILCECSSVIYAQVNSGYRTKNYARCWHILDECDIIVYSVFVFDIRKFNFLISSEHFGCS
jgi:hypothetical protein